MERGQGQQEPSQPSPFLFPPPSSAGPSKPQPPPLVLLLPCLSLAASPWEEHKMNAPCTMEGRILDVASPLSSPSSLSASSSSSAHGRSMRWESRTSRGQSTTTTAPAPSIAPPSWVEHERARERKRLSWMGTIGGALVQKTSWRRWVVQGLIVMSASEVVKVKDMLEHEAVSWMCQANAAASVAESQVVPTFFAQDCSNSGYVGIMQMQLQRHLKEDLNKCMSFFQHD